MNASSLLVTLALALALFPACIQEEKEVPGVEIADSGDSGTDSGDSADSGTPPSNGGLDGSGDTDLDNDGRIDGIGTDEVVPYGDGIYISKRRLPTTNLEDLFFVGRGLSGEEDWCSDQVVVQNHNADFVFVLVPAYVADNGYLFGNVRWMPDGECVDSGEQKYWGSLDDLYGQDPAICPNPEDEYRKGILVNFDGDGKVVNPMDCTAAIGDNDSGNDDGDDDDIAGVPDDDTDTDSGDSDDDGDSGDDGGTDTDSGDSGDDGDSDTDSGDSIVVEVCVVQSTSAYRLGYMDEGTSDRTHWVTETGDTATVEEPILTGSEGDEGCVPVTLTGPGTTLKFNGYGSNSTLWGHYLVGSGSGSSYAYTSGSTASEVEVTVDDTVNGSSDSGAETATFDGYDLAWTD